MPIRNKFGMQDCHPINQHSWQYYCYVSVAKLISPNFELHVAGIDWSLTSLQSCIPVLQALMTMHIQLYHLGESLNNVDVVAKYFSHEM